METLADQVTQQQLTSPELIRRMLHSVSPRSPGGYVVTPAEFSEIMGTVTNIAAGIMTAGILGMLFRIPVLMLQTEDNTKRKPLPTIGSFDIKPVEVLEREYEEFIKPYWERIGEVLVHRETLTELPFKEFDRLYKEKRRREREIKRAKAYEEWRKEQTVPQVKLAKLDHVWEKCPVCGCDVGSVWPPQPAIQAFDLKETKYAGVPLVPVFKCTECGAISADYNRYVYVRREWIERGKTP